MPEYKKVGCFVGRTMILFLVLHSTGLSILPGLKSGTILERYLAFAIYLTSLYIVSFQLISSYPGL